MSNDKNKENAVSAYTYFECSRKRVLVLEVFMLLGEESVKEDSPAVNENEREVFFLRRG